MTKQHILFAAAAALTFSAGLALAQGEPDANKFRPSTGNVAPFSGGRVTVVAKDCMWGGVAYSKGASLQGADGKTYYCSGDDDGTWALHQ